MKQNITAEMMLKDNLPTEACWLFDQVFPTGLSVNLIHRLEGSYFSLAEILKRQYPIDEEVEPVNTEEEHTCIFDLKNRLSGYQTNDCRYKMYYSTSPIGSPTIDRTPHFVTEMLLDSHGDNLDIIPSVYIWSVGKGETGRGQYGLYAKPLHDPVLVEEWTPLLIVGKQTEGDVK